MKLLANGYTSVCSLGAGNCFILSDHLCNGRDCESPHPKLLFSKGAVLDKMGHNG